MSVSVISCLENIVAHMFHATNIKHKGKIPAVQGIFKNLNGVEGRILEGDGKAWDVTVSAECRIMIENKLIMKVAEELYKHGDAAGSLSSWIEAGLNERKKKRRKVTYKKCKQFAKILLDAFRASGDRGTSILNWLVNFILWACVLLDKPHEAVLHPEQTTFKQKDGKIVTFARGMEGDDSILKTNTPKTDVQIIDEWSTLGFTMELATRRPGDAVRFVGLTALVKEDGRIGGILLPEPNRNVASASWSRLPGPPEQYAISFAARSVMFGAHPPLRAYFQACGKYHWERSEKVCTVLSRDDQFRLHGDFDPSRVDTFDRLVSTNLFPGFSDVDFEESRKLIAAYCGEAMTPDQEAHLQCFDVIAPEDTPAIIGCFPAAMLH
jgi:hypothetical protein